MANINTHGIKINGLRKAAHETKGLSPYGDVRTQISYDRDTGDIYTNDHIGDDWSRYYDPAVITYLEDDTVHPGYQINGIQRTVLPFLSSLI